MGTEVKDARRGRRSVNKHQVKAARSAVVSRVIHHARGSDSLEGCRERFHSTTFKEIAPEVCSALVTEGEGKPTFLDILAIVLKA